MIAHLILKYCLFCDCGSGHVIVNSVLSILRNYIPIYVAIVRRCVDAAWNCAMLETMILCYCQLVIVIFL